MKISLLVAMVLLSGCASAPPDESVRNFFNVLAGGTAAGLAVGSTIQRPTVYYAPPAPRHTRCYRVFNEVRCDSY